MPQPQKVPYPLIHRTITEAKAIHTLTQDPMILSAMKLLADPHMDAFVESSTTLTPQEQKALAFLTTLADAYFVLHGKRPTPSAAPPKD
jgi:hypothetical protein